LAWNIEFREGVGLRRALADGIAPPSEAVRAFPAPERALASAIRKIFQEDNSRIN
jgi:hypothetical protein